MFQQGLIILAVFVAAIVAQNPLTVNTPSSVQACLPVQLTWGGGVPPYYVSVIPGGQAGSPAVKDFGEQDANSLTWNVDQPASTSLTVQIRDKNGTLNYSDKFLVQPSTSTCTTGGSGSGNSSSSNPPKSGSTPSTSTPTGKPGGSSPSGTTTSPSTGGNSPSTGGNSSPTSPAATAAPASDASRNLPGLLALALTAAVAVFA